MSSGRSRAASCAASGSRTAGASIESIDTTFGSASSPATTASIKP
jgi:hypothetical protein